MELLRQHINQQVEVTGRLNSEPNRSSSPDGARQSAGDSGEAVGQSGNNRVQVESVRMIAATCSK